MTNKKLIKYFQTSSDLLLDITGGLDKFHQE